MAEYTNLHDLFGDIADSIRDKAGTDEPISAQSFPEAIDGLVTIAGSESSAAKILTREIEDYMDYNGYVTTIGSSAMIDCQNLSIVYFPKATFAGTWCWYSCTSLQTAVFDSIEQIDSYAFRGCTNLENLIFRGSSIPTLANYALSSTPFSSSSYLGHYGSIYCRESLVEDMKVAKNWSSYARRIVPLTDEMKVGLGLNEDDSEEDDSEEAEKD